MDKNVVQGTAFEKAQERAREERLRIALETEMAAHRNLCEHYNFAIEKIAELEAREKEKIRELRGELEENSKNGLKNVRLLEAGKFRQRILLAIIAISLFFNIVQALKFI